MGGLVTQHGDHSADTAEPSMRFPEQPRERIAIASYPFREYIAGRKDARGGHKLELKDFSAHVAEKFNITKSSPGASTSGHWTRIIWRKFAPRSKKPAA
jgi:hypothetical protein